MKVVLSFALNVIIVGNIGVVGDGRESAYKESSLLQIRHNHFSERVAVPGSSFHGVRDTIQDVVAVAAAPAMAKVDVSAAEATVALTASRGKAAAFDRSVEALTESLQKLAKHLSVLGSDVDSTKNTKNDLKVASDRARLLEASLAGSLQVSDLPDVVSEARDSAAETHASLEGHLHGIMTTASETNAILRAVQNRTTSTTTTTFAHFSGLKGLKVALDQAVTLGLFPALASMSKAEESFQSASHASQWRREFDNLTRILEPLAAKTLNNQPLQENSATPFGPDEGELATQLARASHRLADVARTLDAAAEVSDLEPVLSVVGSSNAGLSADLANLTDNILATADETLKLLGSEILALGMRKHMKKTTQKKLQDAAKIAAALNVRRRRSTAASTPVPEKTIAKVKKSTDRIREMLKRNKNRRHRRRRRSMPWR